MNNRLSSKLATWLIRARNQVFLGLLLLFSIAALQPRIQMLLRKSSQKLNLKLVDSEHNISFKQNHLQPEDTVEKQPQVKQENLLDIHSHVPQMLPVQQWPHGIR